MRKMDTGEGKCLDTEYNGGPWEWRTLAVADPGSGEPSPSHHLLRSRHVITSHHLLRSRHVISCGQVIDVHIQDYSTGGMTFVHIDGPSDVIWSRDQKASRDHIASRDRII